MSSVAPDSTLESMRVRWGHQKTMNIQMRARYTVAVALSGAVACGGEAGEGVERTSASDDVASLDDSEPRSLDAGASGSRRTPREVGNELDPEGPMPEPGLDAGGGSDERETNTPVLLDGDSGVPQEPDAVTPDSGRSTTVDTILDESATLPATWRVDAVAVRDGETCVTSNGTLFCAEGDHTGALPREDLRVRYLAGDVLVRQISSGARHLCAALANDTVHCWGDNQFEQLGLGIIALGAELLAVSAGYINSCALSVDGATFCWGDAVAGQLGSRESESALESEKEPVLIGLAGAAQTVSIGGEHLCAILADGVLTCWGSNVFGEGGWSDMGETATPIVNVGDGRDVRAVVIGWHHTCALLDQGEVKCWGLNDAGQLGLGDAQTRGQQPEQMGDQLPVVDLGTGRGAVQLAAGTYHTCALLDDGTVKCWGGAASDKGFELAVGDAPGEMGDDLQALELGAGRVGTAVVARGDRTCAQLDDDSVRCWRGLPR